MRSRAGLSRRGWSFALVGLALIATGAGLGLTEVLAAGVLVLALPVLALPLVLSVPRLKVRRTLRPSSVEVGGRTEVEVELEVDGVLGRRLPTARYLDGVPPQLGGVRRLVLGVGRRGEELVARYALTGSRRGRHEIGPVRVITGDPLGMTRREVVVGSSSWFTVVPQVWPLGLPPSLPGVDAGGVHRGRQVGLPGDHEPGVREYRIGDDRRRVHWPSTARTGELMMRQEEEPRRRRAVVVLDTRRRSHPTSEALEWSVEAAASIAHRLLQDRWQVHLVAPSGPAQPATALQQTADALDVLATVGPTESVRSGDLFGAVADAGGGGAALVVAVLGPVAPTEVSALPPHGGTRLALLLGDDEGTASALRARGWQVAPAGPGTDLASIWAGLGERAGVRR